MKYIKYLFDRLFGYVIIIGNENGFEYLRDNRVSTTPYPEYAKVFYSKKKAEKFASTGKCFSFCILNELKWDVARRPKNVLQKVNYKF